jgi:very-short-patch-repair endonuclease
MDLFALDRLAAPRAGVVARAELEALGWSDGRIAHAVHSGALIRVWRGVYRLAGVAWTRRAGFHAAVLAVGADAHLARWSAAELHGFCEPRPRPVDVLIPHRRTVEVRTDGFLRISRTRALPEPDRAVVGELPVTAPARTVLDLAATTATTRLAELVAAAIRVHACGVEDLQAVMSRRPNVRGRGRLRQVLHLLDEDGGRSRSDVEVVALRELVRAGLPRPAVAFKVHDDQGRFVAEVDLAYPEVRLAIEIDGYRWHSTPAQKRADEDRQNRLVLAGWTVLRFSAAEVRSDPRPMVQAIRTALAQAPAAIATRDTSAAGATVDTPDAVPAADGVSDGVTPGGS